MSRLTERDKDCCQTCRNMGWCNMDEVCSKYRLYEKLAHYEDLEAEGRLIELPCKIGDTVYRLTTRCDKDDCPPIDCDKCDFDEQFVGIRKFKFGYETIYLTEKQLGKTVFLTKAEAEQKLAELKGGGGDEL